MSKTYRTEKRIKQDAKKLSNKLNISLSEAFEKISRDMGFSSWIDYKDSIHEQELLYTTALQQKELFIDGDSDGVINFENIKKELQGQNGLIKKVRERHIPNTQEMAQLAQAEYQNKYGIFSNVDDVLNKLLTIEYDIYLKKQSTIIDNFIEYSDAEATSSNYPIVRKIINDYKSNVRDCENPTTVLTGITYISIALADSNRQSRVSRSGSSLMHHISYLLQKKGFVFGQDYQREFVLKDGCKLDFFFPNLEIYNKEPKNCCAVACQTTSNDRFRLTFAQMPKDTRNRACTAIGNSNFSKKLGPDSLTSNKLAEAKKQGVKFVIISDAIDERLKNSNAVMSYQDWFDELILLKSFY